MTEFLNPSDIPLEQYGLSSGAATGELVFAAGMALDLDTLQRVPEAETIADEARICLDAVEKVLKEAGLSLRDVIKTTCYLSDDSYRAEFWEAYNEVFAPGPYPARVTLVVGIAGDCRIEIDAVAVRPSD